MSTPRLSICIPSNGPLARSKASLDSAIALLAKPEIEVVISDNSGDEAKKEYLRSNSRKNFKVIFDVGLDVMANWRNAIFNSSGDYIMPFGDDDILTALPELELPSDVDLQGYIGFRPATCIFNKSGGISSLKSFSIDGVTKEDRIIEYKSRCGGSNVTLYSAFHRDIWYDLFNSYIKKHPTNAGYSDWSWMFRIISKGRILRFDHLVYFYNNANWRTREDIEKNTKRSAVSSGIPESATFLLMLFRAIDALVAIFPTGSVGDVQDSKRAGFLVFNDYYSILVNDLCREIEGPGARDKLKLYSARLMLSARSDIDRLALCIELLGIWAPGLLGRYLHFINNELHESIVQELNSALSRTRQSASGSEF